MPDLLCYCPDRRIMQDVEALCSQLDIRIKSTVEFSIALEWAKLRSFDCMVLDMNVSEGERGKLTERIWQHDPASPVYMYDPKGEIGERGIELVIEGILPLSSGNARERLFRILDTLKKSGNRVREPFSVLVVEDLDSPRDIICSYIESFGFGPVDGVGSAGAALKVLEGSPEKYSCIVTDIRMPDVSGKELIEQIRMHPKLTKLPVVVLTAYGTVDCLVDCLKAGATGFLVKPPRKQDLLRELGRAIRIVRNHESPRLAGIEEAELLERILIEKGL